MARGKARRRHGAKRPQVGRYDLLDKLVGMLGGVAPVDAIRVYRETPYMSNIPGLADFDPDRAERVLEHYPGGGTERPPGMADYFRQALREKKAEAEAASRSAAPSDPRERPDPPYPTPIPANVVDIDTRRW